ncbi:MAG: hypothetical protein AABZ94_00190 [Candidatus Eisenbacteria bacterium]
MIVALQMVLILLVGGFVLAPVVRQWGQRIPREADVVNRRRSIDERKNRLYRQLVDLDFDKDSGKISPEDHARMREETMSDVLLVLAEEERLGLASPAAPESDGHAAPASPNQRVERMIEEMKKRQAASLEAS